MEDVAAKSGTSIGVVSVVLNGAKSKTLRVGQETRTRVLETAKALGYRRNLTASALATGRTKLLGLMLPAMESFRGPDPYYSMILTGFSSAASREGYDVILFTSVSDVPSDRANAMLGRMVEGVLLVLLSSDSDIADLLEGNGIATASVSSQPGLAGATINLDEQLAGRLATEHLISLGHARIAHHPGDSKIYTTEERAKGYRSAMAEAGLPLLYPIPSEGGFHREAGYETAHRLLSLPENERPTAIFAANDMSAHGVIEAAEALGLRVPQDLSVVGCDNTWYASLPSPRLTTVDMRVEEQGRRGAHQLIHSIEGQSSKPLDVLIPELVVRQSSAPPLGPQRCTL